EERAKQTQAAGAAAKPKSIGPPENEFGPRQTRQSDRQDKSNTAPGQRDGAPIACILQKVSELPHPSCEKTAREHPDVRKERMPKTRRNSAPSVTWNSGLETLCRRVAKHSRTQSAQGAIRVVGQ